MMIAQASLANIPRLYIEALTCRLIQSQARRAQGTGRGEGARAPAGFAAGRVDLVELKRRAPGGGADLITPLGYKTATRALAPVIGCLGIEDVRRRAAMIFLDAAEQVGASGAGVFGEGGDTNAGPTDGGAVARVSIAHRLGVIEAVANDWAFDPKTRRYIRGPARVVMRAQRAGGYRQEIKAFELLEAVCIEARPMKEILERAGWSAHSKHRVRLTEEVLDMLGLIAEAFSGPGRARR